MAIQTLSKLKIVSLLMDKNKERAIQADFDFMSAFRSSTIFEAYKTFSNFSDVEIDRFKKEVEDIETKYGKKQADFVYVALFSVLNSLTEENAQSIESEFEMVDFVFAIRVTTETFQIFIKGEHDYPFSKAEVPADFHLVIGNKE